MAIISFEEALRRTEDMKRHLLIGNGFSIALFPNFMYKSLFDSTDFSGHPQAKAAFAALNTTDFEKVIQALLEAVALSSVYGVDSAAKNLMKQHADDLKELLVQAIAGNHPDRPNAVSDDQFAICRKFLAAFIGHGRSKGVKGKELRGAVFSLNYDLLLYWVLMHNAPEVRARVGSDGEAEFTVEGAEDLKSDDGFRAPDDPDAEYVTWEGLGVVSQCVNFIHGALHLFDYGTEVQKKCWERSGGVPLVDQIRAALDSSRFPLFVSEGNSDSKLDRINHSAYLHKCFRNFRQSLQHKVALFIYGHSLASSDDHILEQIVKAKFPQVFISLYSDPASPEGREIIARGNALATARGDDSPLKVTFYDARSTPVWR
ncbi:MAG: DUF4917 family protein [Acidobacteriaceae bacterium]|nr:DUF4917 family protein [Acidobacteriaceae bacterium]